MSNICYRFNQHPQGVEEVDKFERLRNQIDKDVVRTDRLSAYYSGEGNQHLVCLL